MELGLTLGDTPRPFRFPEKHPKRVSPKDLGLDFSVDLSIGRPVTEERKEEEDEESDENERHAPIQLDLLPHSPVPRNLTNPYLGFPWPLQPPPSENEEGEERAGSPNSAASSFQMEFGLYGTRVNNCFRTDQMENGESERCSSRASDEDENGSTRKKLRLSKDQSAFLEESFKEHNTLNPRQKLALAKQLNLRPRQVEVWFQNRRARTKLKQTEVDCEYLKRCCETLTEENRRLQKELQELRALKSTNSLYMQLPATTLTMCPSCERVTPTSATTTTSAVSSAAPAGANPHSKSRSYPFAQMKTHQSTTS